MQTQQLAETMQEQIDRKSGFLLSEAYFGKPDNLVKATQHLDNIVEKIRKNNYYTPLGSKDLAAVEKYLEKQFNVESVTLLWMPMNSASNAMTMPVSNMVLTTPSSMDIKRTNNSISYKEKKGKHINIFIYSALVTVSGLDGAGLMAVILHEMGHNFYMKESYFWVKKISIIADALSNLFRLKNNDGKPVGLSSLIYILTFGNRIFRKGTSKLLKSMPESDEKFENVVAQIFDVLIDFNVIVGGFIALPNIKNIVSPQKMLQSLFNTMLGGYSDEKFSDNFATIHGYGAELAMFAKEINTSKGKTRGAKIVNEAMPKGIAALFNAQSFIVESIVMLCDCHPNNYVRVYDQAKLLKTELKKENLHPEVKKQIIKDLESIESIYESMTSAEYFEENNEDLRGALFSLIGFAGRDRKDHKEFFMGTKDYEWESLKEKKDRNKLKGFFLG